MVLVALALSSANVQAADVLTTPPDATPAAPAKPASSDATTPAATSPATATTPAAAAPAADATPAPVVPNMSIKVTLASGPHASAVAATQTISYQDNFSGKGELNGASPDVKNTGTNKWTVANGAGSYTMNGSSVSDTIPGYDATFLPVNGTSGVTLDGKQNFTLSATVSPDSTGWLGISLNTAPIPANENLNDAQIAQLTTTVSESNAYNGPTKLMVAQHDGYTAGTPYVISLTYHAKSGTITYTVGDKVIATATGIKPDQIAALAIVAMGNGNSTSAATFSNFTLGVGGSD